MTEVSISKIIVVPDINTSLLSVPALVKMDIGVLFVPARSRISMNMAFPVERPCSLTIWTTTVS